MAETKHTPGPWTLTQDVAWPFGLLIHGPSGDVLEMDLNAYSSSDRTAKEANAREGNAVRIANARLIAAAPDLYASVIALNAGIAAQNMGAPLPRDVVNRYQRDADKAIAKAEGKS